MPDPERSSFDDYDGAPSQAGTIERRRQPRFSVSLEVHLAWLPPWHGRFSGYPNSPSAARLIDLSTGGAGVLIPTSPWPVPGARASLRIGEGVALVEVRHLRPAGNPDFSIFGVEFVRTDRAFERMLDELLADVTNY